MEKIDYNGTLRVLEDVLGREPNEAEQLRVQTLVDGFDFTEPELRKALGIMIANVDRFSIGYLKVLLKLNKRKRS